MSDRNGFLEGEKNRGRALSVLNQSGERGGEEVVKGDWIEAKAATSAKIEVNEDGTSTVLGEKLNKTETSYFVFMRDQRGSKFYKVLGQAVNPADLDGLLCLSGSGQATVTARAAFAPGGDAKLKSIILKIQRGKMTKKDLPEVARPFVHPSMLEPVAVEEDDDEE